jgi:hypothetical protein
MAESTPEAGEGSLGDQLKAKVWQALKDQQPLPDIEALMSLPITPADIYYLLQRWGILTIWDAFNLDPPDVKKPLHLQGMSEHYHVYDRGSSLIMGPKDLFSMDRTINDGLITAKALAREVYQRGWAVEMAGWYAFMKQAWTEFQHLGDKHGQYIEIINYTPTPEELRTYRAEVAATTSFSPQ